jgi:hypothetical protein
MNSLSNENCTSARDVKITDDELLVELADGRKISVPLVWFPRLFSATAAARAHWEILGDGEGIHWPEADEDISVGNLLIGARGTHGLISGAA